jgi:hypothetical protein
MLMASSHVHVVVGDYLSFYFWTQNRVLTAIVAFVRLLERKDL